jgi:hypothetical protein
MELASMLADEPFGDRPASVCPVIGGLLRTYNDALDDERRQDLYAYAARVVGSRCGEVTERRRADRCAQWTERIVRGARARRLRGRLRPFRHAAWANVTFAQQGRAEAAGIAAGRAAVKALAEDPASHEHTLRFVDELLAIGGSPRPAAVRGRGLGDGDGERAEPALTT